MDGPEESSVILNKIRTISSDTSNSDLEKKLTAVSADLPNRIISKEQTIDTTSFGTESFFKP